MSPRYLTLESSCVVILSLDLLLDYQHHKRKGEVIAEKLAGATGSKRDALLEEQKQRQVKINTSSSKLRETTDFIVASISAFEYTYPRLRKHVCAAFVAVNMTVANLVVQSSCDIFLL